MSAFHEVSLVVFPDEDKIENVQQALQSSGVKVKAPMTYSRWLNSSINPESLLCIMDKGTWVVAKGALQIAQLRQLLDGKLGARDASWKMPRLLNESSDNRFTGAYFHNARASRPRWSSVEV